MLQIFGYNVEIRLPAITSPPLSGRKPKHRDRLCARALVIVTEAVVQVQPARDLPGVLRKQVKAVEGDLPFLVSTHDRGLIDVQS